MSSKPDEKQIREIETCLRSAISEPALTIKSLNHVSGGDINLSYCAKTNAHRKFMLKLNSNSDPAFFGVEKAGLLALGRADGPRVVTPLCSNVFEDQSGSFLVLEWIETSQKIAEFSEEFGRSLAALHRSNSNQRFGFDQDNFIGSTPQVNSWCEDWSTFWCEHRMRFQIELAVQNGFGSSFAANKLDRFLDRVGTLLSESMSDEVPALIHGDLWSGNYLVGPAGEPVLIDPAVYYASREAEFGMTTLFGGFDQRFYAAYQEAYPVEEGYEDRIEIYKLYHLLNHLNLFGSSYLSSCLSIINRWI